MLSRFRCLRCCLWLFGIILLLGGCDATAAAPRSAGASTPDPTGGKGVAATATTAPVQTPPQTTDWQTYQDRHYSFSVRYPQAWTALPDAHLSETPAYENVNFFPGTGQSAPALNVITITAGIEQADNVESGPPQGFTPAGTVTVGGVSEMMFSGPGANGGQELLVLYDQAGQLYLFACNADTASAATFKQTFTAMLATFQV